MYWWSFKRCRKQLEILKVAPSAVTSVENMLVESIVVNHLIDITFVHYVVCNLNYSINRFEIFILLLFIYSLWRFFISLVHVYIFSISLSILASSFSDMCYLHDFIMDFTVKVFDSENFCLQLFYTRSSFDKIFPWYYWNCKLFLCVLAATSNGKFCKTIILPS